MATKRLSVFAILAHLHVTYCPGGISEKQMLLRNLEEPAERSNLHDTVVGLRRWLRWRARAQEIGATEPDPSILVKGLNRLTRRTLEGNESLRFRVSLARNALQVDTNPNALSVSQFATHLIAEIDQLSLAEKRSGGGGKREEGKVKKLEDGSATQKTKGNEAKIKEMEVKSPCKFYLSENGCRRGRDCKWSHDQKDEQKRCYTCGSTKHKVREAKLGSTEEEWGLLDSGATHPLRPLVATDRIEA